MSCGAHHVVLSRAKQAELREEIERVKIRRAEREAEKAQVRLACSFVRAHSHLGAQMEEVRDMQKRNYESDVVEGWEQKEEQFHLNQVGYPLL